MTLGSPRVERLTQVAQSKVFGSLQLQLRAVIHLGSTSKRAISGRLELEDHLPHRSSGQEHASKRLKGSSNERAPRKAMSSRRSPWAFRPPHSTAEPDFRITQRQPRGRLVKISLYRTLQHNHYTIIHNHIIHLSCSLHFDFIYAYSMLESRCITYTWHLVDVSRPQRLPAARRSATFRCVTSTLSRSCTRAYESL